jgi:predicted nucleic acid-binding protein
VKVFIDTNIAMYAAGSAHPHREPALRFLARVQAGEIEGWTNAEVLQEVLHRYWSEKRLEFGLAVYERFAGICPRVLDVTLADLDRACHILSQVSNVGVRDAIHAAVMLNHGIHHIATFDRDFDRIPGIERIELS